MRPLVAADNVIQAGDTVFPNNVQSNILARFNLLLPGINYVARPLRASDPNESVGVFPTDWIPDNDSLEIRANLAGAEPTINRYNIAIQGFVKDGDEVSGLSRHSLLSNMLRAMLYRDATLAVSLRALSVDLFGSTETLKRYGVGRQRYISNDIRGTWLYLSTTEFWFETETVPD